MTSLYRIENKTLRFTPHPGQWKAWESDARFTFVIAGTQSGKALSTDTPIPTPNGFVPLEEIKAGDTVFDDKGQTCEVIAATDVMHGRKCYRITFDDGSTIVADADHQWLTQTYEQRKNEARQVAIPDESWIAARPQCQRPERYSVRTTKEIKSTLYFEIGNRVRNNHSIPLVGAIEYPEAALPIPPYTFGCWLGDGYSHAPNIVVADHQIIENIKSEGVNIEKVNHQTNTGKADVFRFGHTNGSGYKNHRTQDLNELGVISNKHIPDMYLAGSVEQRIALLQGLMDTDGYCGGSGQAEFTATSERLALDFLQLTRSLGIKSRLKCQPAKLYGRVTGNRYRIFFSTQLSTFKLDRKAIRQDAVQGRPDIRRRFIQSVESVDSVPVKCIQVNSPSSLYVAGRDYIITHNTSFAPWWLKREIDTTASPDGDNDYIAATASYDLFKLKFLPEMRNTFEHLFRCGRYWSADRVIELADPKKGYWAKRADDPMWGRIILRSAQSPGGLESATAKAAVLDECGQNDYTLETWEAVLRRLALHQGRVLGVTTPYNLAWLKTEVYDKWAEGDRDYNVINFASTLNPSFPQQEFERAKDSMQSWRFNMFYLGLFTRPAGLIYSDFTDDMLVDPFDIPTHWPRVVGVDFGGANTATIHLAEGDDGVWYAYLETLEGGKSTKEHVDRQFDLLGDATDYEYVGGARSETQQRMDWDEAGLYVNEPAIPDVEGGIDRVIQLIKTGRFKVFRTLRKLRDDVARYQRKLDDMGNPTDEILNKRMFHLIDALRYAAIQIIEGSQVYVGSVTMRVG